MTSTTATEVVERVYDRLDQAVDDATIRRFVAGPSVVGVAVDAVVGGTRRSTAGLAHWPSDSREANGPASDTAESNAPERDATAVTPGDDPFTIANRAVVGGTPAERAIGMATINALSAPFVDWQTGDPMASLDPDVDRIVTVGLFRPAFRKFSDVTVRVIERNPEAVTVDPPAGVTVEVYGPEAADDAFEGVDVAFVTGATLVYGGIDQYLSAARGVSVPTVVLIGATASMLPGPAFEAGVTLLAGARVDDEDRVFERIRAGDCDTDLHDAGLQKVYVAASETHGIDLQASDAEEKP